MVFSSLPFLFVFAPLFFLIYSLVPVRWKNGILLLGSLAFYAYGVWETPQYMLLLLAAILVNWRLGLHLGRGQPRRKLMLALGLIYNIGWLVLFKYAGFFRDNLAALWGLLSRQTVSARSWELLLPLGISFYTFQCLSYLLDVYHERVQPERSLTRMALYISLFPKLTAGPLTSYRAISGQLQERQVSWERGRSTARSFSFWAWASRSCWPTGSAPSGAIFPPSALRASPRRWPGWALLLTAFRSTLIFTAIP